MQIGIIDLERLLDQSAAGKDMSRQLEGRARAWQRDLQTLEAEVTKLAQGTVGAELQVKQLEMRQAQERMRMEIETTRNEMRQTLLARIEEIAAGVAKERNIDLILARPNPIVVYAAPDADLTDAVMKGLDAAR